MPSAPSSSLRLDISCLRYLVSRHHSLSQLVLPSAAALPKYERALTRLHGPGGHTRLIAMQALHTAMSTISSSLFNSSPHDERDLFTVIRMVHYIIGLDLDDTILNPTVQSPLLIAYIHAVIRWYPSLPREQWSDRYRSILDLLRSPVWTSHLHHIQQLGIREFKAAVSSVYKLPEEQVRSRSSPERFAAKFEMDYPLRKLRVTFQRHLDSIRDQLPTLRLGDDHRKPMRKNENIIDVDGVPEFFSDAEFVNAKDGGIEGRFSPMQSDEDVSTGEDDENGPAYNDLHPAPARRKVSGRQRRSGRSSKGSARRSSEEKPKQKPLRKHTELNFREHSDEEEEYSDEEEEYSEEEDEAVTANEEEADDDYHEQNDNESLKDEGQSEVQTPPKQNRNKGGRNKDTAHHVTPADLREMDQLASDAFYGSDDQSQVTHHARKKRSTRASGKRHRASGEKYNPINRDDAERGDGVHAADERSESEELEDNDSEDDVDSVRGPQGEPLRQLKEAASNLSRGTRIPDPLPKSLQEAKSARQNLRRSSSRMYSLAPDARPASPIPDSETPVTRKRTRRFALDDDADDFTQNGKRVRRRESLPKLYGKIVKSGRFQAYEDDYLKAGLEKYGWGAWTEIAKHFGSGKYTRAPMSLKDRARTLEWHPHMFPEPAHKRGRPRVMSERKERDISDEQIEEDVGESNTGDRQA
eukprot:GFKZ01009578.1.p1 GENE.GFKZ01009578.1~~GFKZ01009578.1.p1  ORF type:complete len:697 (+),score=111.54 GFKZ01009578.1:199-2289(+)